MANVSNNRRAFVLLSGGLDSTVCLYKAIHDYAPQDFPIYGDHDIVKDIMSQGKVDWVEAVSINYGQRHSKELEHAATTCETLGIKHTVIDLGDLLEDGGPLTDASKDIPDVSYSDLPAGVSPTFVPFRNGLMLSILAAHAQKWVNAENEKQEIYRQAHENAGEQITRNALQRLQDNKPEAGIYFGAHSEDAANWAYPDCSPEFIGAMANAIYVGCYNQVRLLTPLAPLTKDEIVSLGAKLGVPFENTWSCYKGDVYHCGTCPTCRSRRQAFEIAGVDDPTKYWATYGQTFTVEHNNMTLEERTQPILLDHRQNVVEGHDVWVARKKDLGWPSQVEYMGKVYGYSPGDSKAHGKPVYGAL